MMDTISLQQECEGLISCTCSIFINVTGGVSPIAAQAAVLWLKLDMNEAEGPHLTPSTRASFKSALVLTLNILQ